MKYCNFIIVFLFLGYLSTCTVEAQSNVKFPYTCNFEDPVENSQWVLNSKNQLDFCNDRWYIGSATFADGLHSLYISCDNGNTTNFGFNPNVVVAYREIIFPKSNKNYTFSFDWKNQATVGSGLYFCLIPKSQGVPVSVSNTATLGRLLRSAQSMKLSDGTVNMCLRGSASWSTASLSVPINVNEPMYVAFVWQNNKTDSIFDIMAACVDNFQIVSSMCAAPTDLQVNGVCDTMSLSWLGTSAKYILEYKTNGDDNWRTISLNNSVNARQSYNIIGLSEGVYDIRVKGVCGTDTSAALTKIGVPVFCSDNHCINYVGLSDPNTTCRVGNAGGSYFSPCDPSQYDYGQFEMKSRFTVCWIKNQYDPLTEYKLKTIPDGEMASVRLGNWNVNKEAERIEYKYYVDDVDPGILILKYAVVLEDPRHSMFEQPFFQLTLLGENGVTELDSDCGKAEFYADRDMPSWKIARPYNGDKSNREITWKDWTTMGINLDKYRGQTITIRLTTQDCLQGAHFGYAYYTLGCTKGTINSVSCGATEDQKIEAPMGFDYMWFKNYDDSGNPVEVLSVEREFLVPLSDTEPYYVRCTYTEPSMAKKGCYFDLSTLVSPRFPYADFVLEHNPEECVNKYRLRNRSHVIFDYGDSIVHTSDNVQRVEWVLDGGNVINDDSPYLEAPAVGDTVSVYLKAFIADDQCIDDTVVQVIVPSIITDTVTVDTTICESAFPFLWEIPGNPYVCGEPGEYFDTRNNYAGCDSVTKLVLKSTPAIEDVSLDTFVCYGDSLIIEDGRGTRYVFRQSIKRSVVFKSFYGCDSVIKLNLEVRDPVNFSLSSVKVENEPNSGEIIIGDAPDKYTYLLDGEPEAPLVGLAGGEYEVILIDSLGCMSEPQHVTIETECLEVDIDVSEVFIACADEDSIVIPVDIKAGVSSGYSIVFGELAKSVGFRDTTAYLNGYISIVLPDACLPGYYDALLTINDAVCDNQTYPVRFDILYPASVVIQKWNDVLAVLNSHYNGGYEFSDFLWFADGQPIPGAVLPYYYVSGNVELDASVEYHVLLTRLSDGVSIETCPITVTKHTDIFLYPQLLSTMAGAKIRLDGIDESATVSVFDFTGRVYSRTIVNAAEPEVGMPAVGGFYILIVEFSDGRNMHCRVYVK